MPSSRFNCCARTFRRLEVRATLWLLNPGEVWFRSTQLYALKARRRARLLKAYNYLFFKAVLPPEARLAEPVRLGHYGLAVVVHPNVSIGRNVTLWHGVTLSVSDSPGAQARITIEDDVEIGTNAVVISRLRSSLLIGRGVRVGANSVVTSSLVSPGSYGGIPARRLGKDGDAP